MVTQESRRWEFCQQKNRNWGEHTRSRVRRPLIGEHPIGSTRVSQLWSNCKQGWASGHPHTLSWVSPWCQDGFRAALSPLPGVCSPLSHSPGWGWHEARRDQHNQHGLSGEKRLEMLCQKCGTCTQQLWISKVGYGCISLHWRSQTTSCKGKTLIPALSRQRVPKVHIGCWQAPSPWMLQSFNSISFHSHSEREVTTVTLKQQSPCKHIVPFVTECLPSSGDPRLLHKDRRSQHRHCKAVIPYWDTVIVSQGKWLPPHTLRIGASWCLLLRKLSI